MNKNLERKLEKIIENTRRDYNLPSISVSIRTKDGRFDYATGQSDLEANIDAGPDTIYCIGSSTKAFIATALCILSEEEKINLDLPIKTYLPWFKMYDDYTSENLTIRDALSHRSGMPRHDTSWLNTPERTILEQVQALEFLQPAYPIRYKFHYQNHMFMLATILVEEITGKTWEEFVTERILKPLHMNDTYIYGDRIGDEDRRKARPYMESQEKLIRIPYNYAKTSGGAGTIYSSTKDMSKWLNFQLEGNDEILKREILKDMHYPHMIIGHKEMYKILFPEVEFTSYGLAWFVDSYRGLKVIHHGGTIDGFKSEQIFLPNEDITISILSNLNQTTAVISIGYEIIDILLGLERIDWNKKYIDAGKELKDKEIKAYQETIKKINIKEEKIENIEEYQGEYLNKGYGPIKILVENKKLYVETIGLRLPITLVEKDKFILVVESYGMFFPLNFTRNEDNEIRELLIPLEESLEEAISFKKEK